MLSCTLTPNRETRPQYVTLVQFVLCYDDLEGAHYLLPVRRTLEWLRRDDGHDYLTCTRVTELNWKELRPSQAHRELVEQWMGHVRDQVKKGARPITVQVVE